MSKKKELLNQTEEAILILSRTTALVAIFLILLFGVFIFALEDSNSPLIPATSDEVAGMVTIQNQKRTTSKETSSKQGEVAKTDDQSWIAPADNSIPKGKEGDQIRYGKELIAHTAKYLGPKGSVAHLSNRMNCQNCHIEDGTKPFAFNFSDVAATYPQFKARSNAWVSIAGRINGCFQRSMNGSKLDTTSKEMKAMVAYMIWLGQEVKKGVKPKNAGIEKLPFLDRAADVVKGKAVFLNNCASCHGKNGEGLMAASGKEYTYPPLWGKNSYNDGAGLYRLSNFAGFVKNNMPFGVNYQHPVLTDEQAWDVAAFVNSQPRPHKDQKADWKNLAKKPFDFPFGPYADTYSEKQHKYGPYQEIVKAHKMSR